jgi:hypothetical protein
MHARPTTSRAPCWFSLCVCSPLSYLEHTEHDLLLVEVGDEFIESARTRTGQRHDALCTHTHNNTPRTYTNQQSGCSQQRTNPCALGSNLRVVRCSAAAALGATEKCCKKSRRSSLRRDHSGRSRNRRHLGYSALRARSKGIMQQRVLSPAFCVVVCVRCLQCRHARLELS